MIAKRYTIFNKHIGGSNRLPQGFHGLNSLHANVPLMSDEAKKLMALWCETQTEVVLMGGSDEQLEALAAALSKISYLPSAKFNEADLRNSCTVVTFVASDRIVAGGLALRGYDIPPFKAEEFLKNNPIEIGEGETIQLTDDEIFVVANVAYLRLAD